MLRCFGGRIINRDFQSGYGKKIEIFVGAIIKKPNLIYYVTL